jgi:hypothetical protein
MAFDWKATLATVAPTLATALGGPLAGTAAKAIAEAIGLSTLDEKGAEQAVLMADPATLARLKEAEMQFQTDLAALDIDLERIHAGDRDSARRREVDAKDRAPAAMSFVILLGFFAAFSAMMFVPFPDASKEALFILLGVLGGMASSITNYYFGSSTGSDLKTKIMARKTDR